MYREIAPVTVMLGEDEARAEAYRRLQEQCAALAKNTELVERVVRAGLADGAYVIECELKVLTDIAKEQPIYTE